MSNDTDNRLDPELVAEVERLRGVIRRQERAIEGHERVDILGMQADAWDAAVAAMVYEDGTPVEIVSITNPYRVTGVNS
jgi:hypothetical protein